MRRGLFPVTGRGGCRAVQSQCRVPPPRPEAAAPGHELCALRHGPASARQSDGLVHRRGNCGMGGGTATEARRSVALLGLGHRHSADIESGIPSGAAADRRLIGSIIALLGLELAVSDHTTLSRRAETLDVVRPRPGSRPVHLLAGSTGLKLCGSGEWLHEKRGTKPRRSWRKLHIAVDADTLPTVLTIRTASMARSTRVTPRRQSSSHHAPAPCRATRPRQHPRYATGTCRSFPNVALWLGRRPPVITGVPWWRPTSVPSNGSSVTDCDRRPIGVERPRSRLP